LPRRVSERFLQAMADYSDEKFVQSK